MRASLLLFAVGCLTMHAAPLSTLLETNITVGNVRYRPMAFYGSSTLTAADVETTVLADGLRFEFALDPIEDEVNHNAFFDLFVSPLAGFNLESFALTANYVLGSGQNVVQAQLSNPGIGSTGDGRTNVVGSGTLSASGPLADFRPADLTTIYTSVQQDAGGFVRVTGIEFHVTAAAQVPEPGSFALMGFAIAVAALRTWKARASS